jgi:hypothetical protein
MDLATELEQGKQSKELMTKILLTCREEYANGEEDFYRLYDFVMLLLVSAADSLKGQFVRKLDETLPFMNEITRATKVGGDIADMFTESLHGKQLFYAACLIYALNVEGEFDDTIRLLYTMYKAGLGQDVPFSSVRDVPIRQIRDEMRILSNAESEILFAGWESNHLRNAVAHMRMEYDESSDTMHFVDVNRNGEIVYDKMLTIEEFGRFYHLSHGVSIIFLELALILRIRDVAFALKPFV